MTLRFMETKEDVMFPVIQAGLSHGYWNEGGDPMAQAGTGEGLQPISINIPKTEKKK